MNNSNEFMVKLEEKQIIEYTKWVLDFGWTNNSDENATIPLLYTKTYGILSPNIVLELIKKGVITVLKIPNAA